jgi:hypothetical protein
MAAVIALPACGGDEGLPDTSESQSDEPSADLEGPAEDVEVIRTWSEELTESDIEAAAEFFATPSQAENGLTYDIETQEDAEFFNESLPCGATLEETSVEGQFITATFELTDRPGVGPCPGSGNLAQTSFVIEDGAIVEWRRVALPGEQDSGQTTS